MQAHVADGPNSSSVAPPAVTERVNPIAAALVAGAVATAVDDAAVVLSSAGPPAATTTTDNVTTTRDDERRDSYLKISEDSGGTGHDKRHSEHLEVNPVLVATADSSLERGDVKLDAPGDSPPAIATTLLSADPPITGGTEEHSGVKEKGTTAQGTHRLEFRMGLHPPPHREGNFSFRRRVRIPT